MAVAAYASLISLTHVLNNLHNRAQLGNIHVDIKQIEYLQESVNYLVEALEFHSRSEDPRVKGIWRQISEVAFEAEETFDLHVVNQLQEKSDEGDKSDFLPFGEDLKGVIQKVDLIKIEVSVVEEVPGDVRVERQSKVSMPFGGSMSSGFGGKNIMVGFDEHLDYIIGELKGEKKLKIIPITGMGGIGKTTLAKNVFDHGFSNDHFDLKIWLTISQEYSVEAILTGLLNDGRVERSSANLAVLGKLVYQKLFGRRYLIVMDDVWSIEAWNDFKIYFPDNENGSRIMVTTRLENVARSLGSTDPYSLPFLNEESSWNLFCQTIFGRDDCPFPELMEIGKTIAKGCRGLPLEITVIGGLLAESNITKEFWESIAENVSSFGNSGYDEHCLKVLSLSYSNLPIHLKPCFLYLQSFPEARSINVSTLIERWIAEGFIKPAEDRQSLEGIAMVYFNDLICRNLIFIISRHPTGEVAQCGVHDLLRDLCSREFDKQHFLPSPKVQRVTDESSCFQCGEEQIYNELHNFVLISPTSSFQGSSPVCGACDLMFLHRAKPRLVRLIDGFSNKSVVHPTVVRYVSTQFCNEEKFIFPSLLNLLWNLQVLKISSLKYGPLVFPNGIWKLPELRHLECCKGAAVLPNPMDNDVEGKDFFILKNLQTLSGIKNMKCTKDVLDRIPNLKELKIRYENEAGDNLEWAMHLSTCNLTQLQSLQSLDIYSSVVKGVIFPNSLKKLFLFTCKIAWDDMSMVGLLPNLELLYLYVSGEGSEWAPVEGEFLQLRVLEICNSDLVKWKADRVHFPKLQELMLAGIGSLEEIPLGIGDIETLRTIHLGGVSESVVESAKQILEEQESMGNEILQIYIDRKKLLLPKSVESE